MNNEKEKLVENSSNNSVVINTGKKNKYNNLFSLFSPYYTQTYKAILSLINKFYWKSKTALFAMFFLPLVFMFIYYAISFSQPNVSVFAGFSLYIAFSVLPITLVSMPQLLVELKQSIILRRISTSNISSFRYIFLMSCYFFGMCTLSVIVIFSLVCSFEHNNIVNYFSVVNFGQYIYGIITFIVIAICLGIIISSIFKTSSWVQILGVGIILFSMMIAGLFIPLDIIGPIPAVKYISLLSPLDYSLGMMNNSIYDAIITSQFTSIPTGKISLPISNFEQLLNYAGYNDVFNDFGKNIFNWNQPFRVLNVSSLMNQLAALTTFTPSSVYNVINSNTTVIYENWEKMLNLIFVYLFMIGSTYLSVKKFTWSSR